jgi:hypothetical protein
VKRIFLCITVIISVLLCQGLLAEPLLVKVIQLQHVQAGAVLPLVKPILDETSSVSGQDSTLVIKATANYMQVIEQLIAQLDKAPQKFLVSLRYGQPQTQQLIAGTDTRDDQFTRSLQTLAGKPALISFSKQARVVSSVTNQQNVAITTATSQQIVMADKTVNSGFVVTASLLNDGQVKVELSQQHAQFSRDSQQNVSSEQLQTELIVSPGQWISVKHGNDTIAEQQQVISTQSKMPQQDDLYLKVELLN